MTGTYTCTIGNATREDHHHRILQAAGGGMDRECVLSRCQQKDVKRTFRQNAYKHKEREGRKKDVERMLIENKGP